MSEHYSALIGKISDKESFLLFMVLFMEDMKTNNEQSLDNYLESMYCWIDDMEGYYMNTKQSIPNIDWSFIATVIYVGKIYN